MPSNFLLLEHAVTEPWVRDPNGRAYNAERKAMMQQWADYLDVLRSGANVVPIKGRKAG